MIKVYNKNTRARLTSFWYFIRTYFTPPYSVPIAKFEQVIVSWGESSLMENC